MRKKWKQVLWVVIEEAFRALSGGFLVFLFLNLAFYATGVSTPTWVFVLWGALTAASFVTLVPVRLITGRELKFGVKTRRGWMMVVAVINTGLVVIWFLVLGRWPTVREAVIILVLLLALPLGLGPSIARLDEARRRKIYEPSGSSQGSE